jgi:putative oxidoreductase
MANGDTRLIIPAFGPLYKSLDGISELLLRVVCGGLLIPHGMQKLFGLFGGNIEGTAGFFSNMGLEPAMALAYYIGTLEVVGGILLVIGLFTRLVAVQVLGFMLVAAFWVHWGVGGYFWTDGGLEYPLMWAAVALFLVIRGGGAMSVDAKLGREF